MVDINASLKYALNGPAPQHKKRGEAEFDFTEGSDGAMHAKIVDQNGNPIDPRNVEITNFPTNQNVTDAEVKAELEQIKATQAEILERLNGPIDTQVTGSIVEEVKIFNSAKIRDTSDHWELVDLSMFKSFTLIANSTLNEYPTITYRTPNSTTPNRVFKNGEWVGIKPITIEDTVNRAYLLNSFWTEFTDTPYASIAFRVRCDVAPTQGEFTLSAWGVLR